MKTKLQKLKESKKRKRRLKIITLLGSVIIIAIIVGINISSNHKILLPTIKEEKTQIAEDKVEINNEIIETINEANEAEVVEVIETEKEAIKIKEIIEKTISENQLNETNFAFFTII